MSEENTATEVEATTASAQAAGPDLTVQDLIIKNYH